MAPLIREVLYAPDGQPPDGWTLGQDMRIARTIVTRWQRSDLPEAIRGLRLVYPTGKLTLRLLVAKSTMEGEMLINRAVAAYWNSTKRKPAAKILSEIFREIAGRGA